MLGYFDIFPNRTATELRTAVFANDDPLDPLTGATFIFLEYFCTDLQCDCQRVLVKVLRAETEEARPEEVATISYSWNPDSDDKWAMINSEMPNPFLDPLHPQTPNASELLDFWSTMIERDQAYASRIERHYEEIRAEVGKTAEKWRQREPTKNDVRQGTVGPRTKRERKARRQRLARVHKKR